MAWRQAYPGVRRLAPRGALERRSVGVPGRNGIAEDRPADDVYNALSVVHLIPMGGEDVASYDVPARLVVATGDEQFDTVDNGQPAVHTAVAGEIVWRDDTGVTCRRWNWRQCVRTSRASSSLASLEQVVPKILRAP